MIRVPLRLSAFGGGCDLPTYYEHHGATIISLALTQYIYLVHNRRPTGGYRVSYSDVEELSTLTSAKHTLVAAAAKKWGDLPPCTLSIISDLPKGTGLGSSSALCLALCELFAKDNLNHPSGLVQTAYALERTVAPVGMQDFLPGAWGGFRVYKIDTHGIVSNRLVPEPLAMQVENNGLMLWTGQSRDAAPILKKSWQKAERELEQIQDLAESVEQELPTMTLQRMGEMLDYSWQVKRRIGGVTTPEFDEQYAKAKEAGAIGAKIGGAGGGGVWFILAPRAKHDDIIKATGLTPIHFGIEQQGCETSYV